MRARPAAVTASRDRVIRNYFRTVFEATKSVADKLRDLTGRKARGSTKAQGADSGFIHPGGLFARRPGTTPRRCRGLGVFGRGCPGIGGLYRGGDPRGESRLVFLRDAKVTMSQ